MKVDYDAIYGKMHESPKIFSGYSVILYAETIAGLVNQFGAARLLDYGSGKGYQYLLRRVHERWGGILPVCYDVGVWQLSERPQGLFDGIICTDVMEHIAEPDVDKVLGDVLSFAGENAFALFGIACRPATKFLPDGRNAHLTVQPPKWWEEKLAAHGRDGLTIRAVYEAS